VVMHRTSVAAYSAEFKKNRNITESFHEQLAINRKY
jgi:hypothetical protein